MSVAHETPHASRVAVAAHLAAEGWLPAFYYGVAGPRCDAYIALADLELAEYHVRDGYGGYRLTDAGRVWLAGQES